MEKGNVFNNDNAKNGRSVTDYDILTIKRAVIAFTSDISTYSFWLNVDLIHPFAPSCTDMYFNFIDKLSRNSSIIFSLLLDANEEYFLDQCIIADIKNLLFFNLNSFLKQIEFHIDSFEISCNNLSESNLYLAIYAKTKEGKTETYIIPLELTSCTIHK